MNFRPIMIMRATQKKMMSKPVTSTLVGIELLQLGRLVGPAQRGERPQRRGEPGVEHILVLAQFHVRRQRVLLAHFGFVAAHVDVAGVVVPGRNAMAPPELAAHAPVLDVAHPFVIGLRPVLRHEADAAVFDRLERGLGERRDLHVPLVGEIGLDDGVGAVAARHLELVRLDLLDEPGGFELGDDLLARLEAVQAAVSLRRVLVELRVGREDVDLRQVVPLAHLVVVEVVRRRDLHAAGAERGIHVACRR